MSNSNQAQRITNQKSLPERERTSSTRSSGASPMAVQANLGAVVQRAQKNPESLTPGNLSMLQRSIGNRAVAQMLGRNVPSASTQTTPSSPFVQAKLTVGPANDLYEQEADRIANTVTQPMNGPSQSAQRSTQSREAQDINQISSETMPSIHRIQRNAPIGADGGELNQEMEQRLRSSQSGGQPMPDTVRRAIEPKLGTDLSSVKVHTGDSSVQLNRALGAKAFTHGNHIYYGAGQSPNDLKLTAHESVHTVQQGAISTNTLQRKKKEGRTFDPKDAEQTVPKEASRFTLTVAAWQDDPNFLMNSAKFVVKKGLRKVFRFMKKPKPPSSTGHSWVELRAYKSGESDEMVFSDSYGFQPTGVKHPETSFHGDSGENVLYRDYNISKEKFLNVIGTAQTIANEDPKYDLKGMNCTKFARTLVMAAGLKFMGNRVVPGAKIGPGKAFTPNRLFSAMASRQKNGKTYKLDKDRKDLKQKPVLRPITLCMTPFLDSENKFQFNEPEKIVRHRPSEMDEGWSEVILLSEDNEEETWYARTDELKRLLSGETVSNTPVRLPFGEEQAIELKNYFADDSEWDMIMNSFGYDKQIFQDLTDKQVTYIAQLWAMPVEEVKKKFAA